MENVDCDLKDTDDGTNSQQKTTSSGNSTKASIIDTINNNINCLIERLQSESDTAKIVACDESSLPSPKAMLETIMPCEKLCSNFRHIADDLSSCEDGDVIKATAAIKSEPKVSVNSNNNNNNNCDDDDYNNEQFPLNLKAFKYGSSMSGQKDQSHVSSLFLDLNLILWIE